MPVLTVKNLDCTIIRDNLRFIVWSSFFAQFHLLRSGKDSDHYVLQLLTCARTLRDWSVTMAVLSMTVTEPSVSVVLVTSWPLIFRHV